MNQTATAARDNRFSSNESFGHYFGWGYFCCIEQPVRQP